MLSYPIPDGPHNDSWKSLLPDCFAVIDEVIRTRGIAFPIQIGGGSMLLRRYGHRKSKDLDLFVTDTRLVRWCSPRFNETAADLFPDYGEEATAVKLVTGLQEVDIIAVAPVILDNAVDPVSLLNRTVLIERPREILAKKIVYRGRTFQPRDVFDLACVAAVEPEEIATILSWINLSHLDDLDARLAEIEFTLAKDLADKVEAYPAFEPIVGQCLDIVRNVLKTWRENLTPKVQVPSFPHGTHRAVYSKDGETVVIKAWDAEKKRFDKISNTLGPAMVCPAGCRFFLGGVEISEEAWRHHPEVTAARAGLVPVAPVI